MPSYNEINGGIPSHANSWLLKEVLRKEWGFTGITVSDYLAVDMLAGVHHVAANNAEAGVLAFKSGLGHGTADCLRFPLARRRC